MTLQGKTLVLALLGAAGAGAVAGVTIEGWRKARGLPSVVSVDAGVTASVDAGVSSNADCAATIEHWNVQYIPGPVRYLPAPDGGVIQRQPETIAVLVPDVRLSGTTSSLAASGAGANAGIDLKLKPATSPPRANASIDLLAKLDTSGKFGGDIIPGVRLFDSSWWLLIGLGGTPPQKGEKGEAHALAGLRKEF